MTNGWTGGQYSLYRGVFAVYLSIHLVTLLPWSTELFSARGALPSKASPLLKLFPNILMVCDTPAIVATLMIIGTIASFFFLLGAYDRTASLLLWYVLTCLSGRNPLIANPSLPFVGWLLLAHAFLPASPYGSWRARTRTDPRGWVMPPELFAAAWVIMSLGYSYSGYSKLISPSWVDGAALSRILNNPLARPTFLRHLLLAAPEPVLRIATWGTLAIELFYAPLAVFSRVRPWIWTAMLTLHLGLMVLIDFADLSFGMVILHLFTFNPQWVGGRWGERRDRIIYDGNCCLCHGVTRFVLAEDRSGTAFTFAPLQGETLAHEITGKGGVSLPDGIAVRTGNRKLLTQSDAVVYILDRLGGMWRVIALAARIVPRFLRNRVYNFIARIRYRLFGRTAAICPVVPADLRSRFQL